MNLEQTLQFEVAKLDRLIKQEIERYDSERHAGRLLTLEEAKSRFEEILKSQSAVNLTEEEVEVFKKMLTDVINEERIAEILAGLLGVWKELYIL